MLGKDVHYRIDRKDPGRYISYLYRFSRRSYNGD